MSNSYPIVHVLNGCTSFNIIVSSNDKVQKSVILSSFYPMNYIMRLSLKRKKIYLLYKTRGSIRWKHGAGINHFRLMYRYQKSSSGIKKKIIIDSKWIHIVVHIDFTHCCVSLHEEGSNKFCDEITRDSLSNKRLKYLYPYFIYGGQTSELKKCNVQSLCPFIRCWITN